MSHRYRRWTARARGEKPTHDSEFGEENLRFPISSRGSEVGKSPEEEDTEDVDTRSSLLRPDSCCKEGCRIDKETRVTGRGTFRWSNDKN